MASFPDREDRLIQLQQKIQDPGYLNTAIQEMANKLAIELFPFIYNSSPTLQDHPMDQSKQDPLL